MSESPETPSVPERLQRLKELTEFTEDCKKKLDDMFEALGWSMDYNSNRDAMEQCPYDANHRVPVTSMERHKGSCSRRGRGYSPEEEAEMLDPSVCYQNNAVRSFTTDKSTQHQVILQARSAAPLMRMEGVFWQGQFSGQPVDVPQNHKRAVCDLTVADRLALYDHVVGVLSRSAAAGSNEDLYVDLVSKLQTDEQQKQPKTHLQLMAEMRDYKRRRQSYRAKNVHITKKSYTEVIREVIRVHSGELSRQWREEEEEEEEKKEEKKEEEKEKQEEDKVEAESTRSELSSHRRRPEEKRPASPESRHAHGQRRRERSPEGERKKKKRKRERDSGSPDEHHHHHHDRKKKKKKKREDREKEK